MRIKHLLSSLLTVAALSLSGTLAAQTVLKFSIGAPDSQGGEILGMKALKEYVEFKSDGKIQIRLFFNTFGGSLQVTEQVKNGTLEMALTDDSVLGSFHKPMQIFQIPYLFASSPIAWEFMKSPFVRELNEDMRKATGMRTLAISENGLRNLTNTQREIKTPDDMKGLKMRTMQSQVYVNFMKSMGAAATPIAFPELITSLKSNVVDGQENAASTVWDAKLYEVQKFMSVNEHIYGMHYIIINDKVFQGLTPDLQKILMDGAAMHAETANSRKSMDSMQAIQKIRSAGTKVHVTTPTEKEAFRKQTQDPVIEFVASQTGRPIVDKLLEAVRETTRRSYTN
ncbi:MAG: TRAP transporter substrate-binding protein [Rhodoferax sp.]|nr:TRAP transporter substrate-binding protein [Rhodoferax sp.]